MAKNHADLGMLLFTNLQHRLMSKTCRRAIAIRIDSYLEPHLP